MQLEGKTALITGGCRGIGRSIALAYAKEGAGVAVVARTGSELDEVAGETRKLGQNGIGIDADLMEVGGASRAVKEAIEGLGKVDILVNNASGYRLFTDDLSHQVNVADMTDEEWQLVMHSNVTTTFLSCKAVLPHMMERGSGAIINLTSRNVRSKGSGGGCCLRRSQGGRGTAGRVHGRKVDGLRYRRQFSGSGLGVDSAQ